MGGRDRHRTTYVGQDMPFRRVCFALCVLLLVRAPGTVAHAESDRDGAATGNIGSSAHLGTVLNETSPNVRTLLTDNEHESNAAQRAWTQVREIRLCRSRRGGGSCTNHQIRTSPLYFTSFQRLEPRTYLSLIHI